MNSLYDRPLTVYKKLYMVMIFPFFISFVLLSHLHMRTCISISRNMWISMRADPRNVFNWVSRRNPLKTCEKLSLERVISGVTFIQRIFLEL